MKHKILSIIGAGLLLMTAWSCREQSDELLAYDHNDAMVFGAAENSFAAKFNVMWNGLNQYYALWDFEAEQGVDWDAAYQEFYPQFAALDKRDKNNPVTDAELKELLDKFLGPLHDGHFHMAVKNHMTGSSVMCRPSDERFAKRDDYNTSEITFSLRYYADVAHGEIETDADGNPIVKEHATDFNTIYSAFYKTEGMGFQWMKARKKELDAKPSLTDYETFELQQIEGLATDLNQIGGHSIGEAIAMWNRLVIQYSFLNVPGFDYIDPAFYENGIGVKYALLKGNIAYFGFTGFELSSYLNDEECASIFDLSVPATQQHVNQMKEVWQSWFDAVQQLHKNGTLGGVIIDVRNNGGGNMDDSQYVVGSLVPAGGIHFGYQRFKRGTGRYEYSPLMPAIVGSMEQPHETITEPVVIMTNCFSVSMSETSALCVKTMPNGTTLGKRSYGAICALVDNEYNSFNYAGYIGVNGVTPVFGKVPSMASFTLDKKIIEAEGITPDIEVDFDIPLFNATGQDTQLDRALQFIRTGK